MRHAHFILGLSLSAAALLSGCSTDQLAAGNGRSAGSSRQAAELTLPSGTAIDVSLTTPLTWKTAGIGDAWMGATRGALIVDGRSLIPGGSPVTGMVTSVKAGENLTSKFRRMVQDFRSSYVLFFTPRGVERAGPHTLEVRVKRPGVEVRARRGYIWR